MVLPGQYPLHLPGGRRLAHVGERTMQLVPPENRCPGDDVDKNLIKWIKIKWLEIKQVL